MIFGHGGNIYEVARQLNCRPSDIIDMSSNINPLGPPPGLLTFLQNNMKRITRLPEVDNRETLKYFAGYLGLEPEQMLVANGTTQFIYSLPRALRGCKALIVGPTYADYQDALNRCRIPSVMMSTVESQDFQPDLEQLAHGLGTVDTVYLCNPNNPTGALIPHDDLLDLCQSHPHIDFIIDESYLPFVAQAEKKSLMSSRLPNVFVLLSISKIFGVPGLRIGFVIAHSDRLNALKQQLLPWNVNSLAQEAVRFVAVNGSLIAAFIKSTQTYCRMQRQMLANILNSTNGIKLFPGHTPYILIKLPQGLTAPEVQNYLLQDLLLIRNCDNFQGLSDQFIRISLKQSDVNRLLGERLSSLTKNAGLELTAGRIAC